MSPPHLKTISSKDLVVSPSDELRKPYRLTRQQAEAACSINDVEELKANPGDSFSEVADYEKRLEWKYADCFRRNTLTREQKLTLWSSIVKFGGFTEAIHPEPMDRTSLIHEK